MQFIKFSNKGEQFWMLASLSWRSENRESQKWLSSGYTCVVLLVTWKQLRPPHWQPVMFGLSCLTTSSLYLPRPTHIIFLPVWNVTGWLACGLLAVCTLIASKRKVAWSRGQSVSLCWMHLDIYSSQSPICWAVIIHGCTGRLCAVAGTSSKPILHSPSPTSGC